MSDQNSENTNDDADSTRTKYGIAGGEDVVDGVREAVDSSDDSSGSSEGSSE